MTFILEALVESLVVVVFFLPSNATALTNSHWTEQPLGLLIYSW